jgi:flagellar biosynthesis protein FlhA
MLTVGDGLVSQIPALIVSTAAGMLVTKAGVAGHRRQGPVRAAGRPAQGLGMVSFLLVGLAALPGIPDVPFLALAGGTGAVRLFTSTGQ